MKHTLIRSIVIVGIIAILAMGASKSFAYENAMCDVDDPQCDMLMPDAEDALDLDVEAVRTIGIFLQYDPEWDEAKIDRARDTLAAGLGDAQNYFLTYSKGHETFDIRGYMLPLDPQGGNAPQPPWFGSETEHGGPEKLM